MDGSQPLDPRKTIFVGGVPRPLRARKLLALPKAVSSSSSSFSHPELCWLDSGIGTAPLADFPASHARPSSQLIGRADSCLLAWLPRSPLSADSSLTPWPAITPSLSRSPGDRSMTPAVRGEKSWPPRASECRTVLAWLASFLSLLFSLSARPQRCPVAKRVRVAKTDVRLTFR